MPISLSGSLVLSGSITISGSITSTGGITVSGSIASSSYATNTTTASYAVNATTASYAVNTTTASYAVNATTAATASFANAFTVANTLTAQTLVVQTITSSIDFVTGSSRFGSLATNTHVFTGSVNITGSLSITTTGTEFQVTSTGANLGNTLTDNHIISGSLTVNPNGLFVSGSGYVSIGNVSGNDAPLAVYGNIYAGYGGPASNRGIYLGNSGFQASLLYNNSNGNLDITPRSGYSTIFTAGNVGIGTSSPSYLLDVNSITDTYGQYRTSASDADVLLGFSNTGDGNNGWGIGRRNTGEFWIASYTGNFLSGTRTVPFQLATSGEATFSSSVGIGFTSPTASLSVNGNASIGANLTPLMLPHGIDTNARGLVIAGSGASPNYGALFLTSNTTEASGVLLGALLYSQVVTGKSGTNAASKAAISVFTEGSGGSVGGYGGYMAFYTRPDNGSSDVGAYERMRITSAGALSLNTGGPGLFTLGASNSYAGISSGGSGVTFYMNGATRGGSGTAASNVAVLALDGDYYITNSAVNSTKVIITSAGIVGIGITNPSATKISLGQGIGAKLMIYDNPATGVYSGIGQDLAAGNSTDIFAHGYANYGFITFGQLGTNKSTYTEWARITPGGLLKINSSGVSPNDSVYKFSTRLTTDRNIAFGTQGGDASIEAFNDAINANVPLRIYASPLYVVGANVKMANNGNNYNENIRTYEGSNGYSSYIMGAVSGDTGSGTGQWSIVRWPSANSYQFTIRYNNTDYFYLYSNGNYSFYGSNVSDARKKTNITYIEDNQLDTIMKLKPATFSKVNPTIYSETDETYTNNNTHTGFIAQDVLAENIPNILTGSEEEGYGLDYDGILALAVKSIQEQQALIQSLTDRITALENK